jgi:hypothetical protein
VCRVCVLWCWPDLAGPPGLYLCVFGSKGSPLFVSKKKTKKNKNNHFLRVGVPHVTILWIQMIKDDVSLKINIIPTVEGWSYPLTIVFCTSEFTRS